MNYSIMVYNAELRVHQLKSINFSNKMYARNFTCLLFIVSDGGKETSKVTFGYELNVMPYFMEDIQCAFPVP